MKYFMSLYDNFDLDFCIYKKCMSVLWSAENFNEMGGVSSLKSFCKKFGWLPLYNRNILMCQEFHSARKITSFSMQTQF
jgi:hypothetical protein